MIRVLFVLVPGLGCTVISITQNERVGVFTVVADLLLWARPIYLPSLSREGLSYEDGHTYSHE